MMIGFTFIYTVFPLPFTLIELKPLTYNLKIPIETFFQQFLLTNVLTLTFYLYRKTTHPNNWLKKILSKTSFYCQLSNTEIWISAIIGLFFTYYLYFIYGRWQNTLQQKSSLAIIAGFCVPFLWMPLMIPFRRLRYLNDKKVSGQNVAIILFSILVTIISIATNVRSILFTGVMMIILLYFVGFLFNYYNIKKEFSKTKLITILFSIILAGGPLIDLGYAMVIVRQERYDTKTSDFLKKTIEIYQDKDKLELAKRISLRENNMASNSDSWDESYLNNFLLNRYCNYKIADNCLYYGEKLGYSSPKMRENLKFQIFAFVPDVMLKIFGITPSLKREVSSYSLTDYLYSLASKNSSVKGSFILGNLSGLGMSLWGYWYLVLIIPLFYCIFFLFDSLALVKNKKIFFSFFFFVNVVEIFNYFNNHHVYTYEIRWILRTYIEGIIFFLLTIKIIKTISKVIS